jgi:hypothetical protein
MKPSVMTGEARTSEMAKMESKMSWTFSKEQLHNAAGQAWKTGGKEKTRLTSDPASCVDDIRRKVVRARILMYVWIQVWGICVQEGSACVISFCSSSFEQPNQSIDSFRSKACAAMVTCQR